MKIPLEQLQKILIEEIDNSIDENFLSRFLNKIKQKTSFPGAFDPNMPAEKNEMRELVVQIASEIMSNPQAHGVNEKDSPNLFRVIQGYAGEMPPEGQRTPEQQAAVDAQRQARENPEVMREDELGEATERELKYEKKQLEKFLKDGTLTVGQLVNDVLSLSKTNELVRSINGIDSLISMNTSTQKTEPSTPISEPTEEPKDAAPSSTPESEKELDFDIDIQEPERVIDKPKAAKDIYGSDQYKKIMDDLFNIISKARLPNFSKEKAQKIVNDIHVAMGNGKFSKLVMTEQAKEHTLPLSDILANNGVEGVIKLKLMNMIKQWMDENSTIVSDQIGKQVQVKQEPETAPEPKPARTDKEKEELADKVAQISREMEPPTTERPTTVPSASGEKMKSQEPAEQGFSDQDLEAAGGATPPEQEQKPKKRPSFAKAFISKPDFPEELKNDKEVKKLLTDLGRAITYRHSIKESVRFDNKKLKMILESELHYFEAKKEPKVFELSKRISELTIDDSLKQKLLELIKAELKNKQINFDYSAPQSASEPESDEEQVQQSASPEVKSDKESDQSPLISALDSIIEQYDVKNRTRWEQMRTALSDLLGDKKQGTYTTDLGDSSQIQSIEKWAELFAANCVDAELTKWTKYKRNKKKPDNTEIIRDIDNNINPALKEQGVSIGIYIAKQDPVKIDPSYMRVVGGAEGGQFVGGQNESGVISNGKVIKTAMVLAGNKRTR